MNSAGIGLLPALPAVVWVVDEGLRVVSLDGALAPSLGLDPEACRGQALGRVLGHGCGLPDLLELHRRALTGSGGLSPLQLAGYSLEVRVQPLPEGGALGMAVDLGPRTQDEQDCRLWTQVFESSRESIVVTDAKNRIRLVNPAFEEVTGYAAAEVIGKSPSMLSSGTHDADFYRTMWWALERDGWWQGEVWNRRKNGEIYPEWLTINVVRDENGKPGNYIGVFSDITDEKAKERHIRFLAEHDFLTGLPNRAKFIKELADEMVGAGDGQTLVLLLIDLDNFKLVNDSLGHTCGDRLLQMVAARIQDELGGDDLLGRQGGDEFLILLTGLPSAEAAASTARGLLARLAEPYAMRGREFAITASIGVAVWPDDGDDAETLVRSADTALYHAKEVGRNSFQFCTSDLNARALHRMSVENDLRRALPRNELVLFYQPKIDIASGRVSGLEALVRWNHPSLGLLSPAHFVGVAEESGLIIALGEWVLEEAARQHRKWLLEGVGEYPIAVNVSALQFRQPNFIEVTSRIVSQYEVNPSMLELELTESILLAGVNQTIEILDWLKYLGIPLTLDDFGTQYSSLSYLRRLPINKVKIDRSFVRQVCSDLPTAAIVRAVITMAHSLGLRVVGEGVETAQDQEWLREAGCDEVQGFLIARPLPADECVRWLAAWDAALPA